MVHTRFARTTCSLRSHFVLAPRTRSARTTCSPHAHHPTKPRTKPPTPLLSSGLTALQCSPRRGSLSLAPSGWRCYAHTWSRYAATAPASLRVGSLSLAFPLAPQVWWFSLVRVSAPRCRSLNPAALLPTKQPDCPTAHTPSDEPMLRRLRIRSLMA